MNSYKYPLLHSLFNDAKVEVNASLTKDNFSNEVLEWKGTYMCMVICDPVSDTEIEECSDHCTSTPGNINLLCVVVEEGHAGIFEVPQELSIKFSRLDHGHFGCSLMLKQGMCTVCACTHVAGGGKGRSQWG